MTDRYFNWIKPNLKFSLPSRIGPSLLVEALHQFTNILFIVTLKSVCLSFLGKGKLVAKSREQ
jgi:hypothetical protein